MDFKNWKRYKRSGTYRREVNRRFEKQLRHHQTIKAVIVAKIKLESQLRETVPYKMCLTKILFLKGEPYSSDFSESSSPNARNCWYFSNVESLFNILKIPTIS